MSQVIDSILYSIQIEPIITDGLIGNSGKYIELSDGQRVTGINFKMVNNVQVMTLTNGSAELEGYSQVRFLNFNITNNILNPIGNANLTTIIDSDSGYNISNTILDLFREQDIIRFYYEPLESGNAKQLMVGVIENINIRSDIQGTKITINIGYLTNILARSQLVQTSAQQDISQQIMTAYNPKQVQLGNFLSELLNETTIEQSTIATKYYSGKDEVIAAGKASVDNPQATKGSALNADSYVYVVTPATDTKLQIILQTLYPYQRVIYVGPNGDLNITPLCTKFDTEQSWKLSLDGKNSEDDGYINCLGINVSKNTAVLQNRAYAALNQSFTQFNQSSNNSVASPALTGVAVATAPQNIFPRAYDMVKSSLGLQTSFVLQTLDINAFLQNSGLLNTAINLPTLEGVTSVLNVNNSNLGITTNNKQDSIKYIMSLYAARELAENLLNDLLLDISMPLVSTYSRSLGAFRDIPLNQMVQIPNVTNKLFDGLQQMFCYGFSLSFDAEHGSILTLNLCKPYVFTAFWASELVEI